MIVSGRAAAVGDAASGLQDAAGVTNTARRALRAPMEPVDHSDSFFNQERNWTCTR